jgi:hypothetical protein
MFVRIGNGNEVINTDAIASATFEEAADQPGHGREQTTAPQLTIQFMNNVPAARTLRGEDARKAWAALQGRCSASASRLETK